MIQTSDVNREAERYLAGQISLRDLALWLAAEGWELRENASDPASLEALDAVRTLDLNMARYTSGLCTREELDAEFRRVLNELPVTETTWTLSGQSRRSEDLADTEYSEVGA